ncbi:RodZ domain-containing protein [Catenovulum agarivorans]|uniref:RodZ domain-containing protein n=1 Tax=Catenovulum agarivorans TaxID=1172192 RepID=UPI0002F745B1|nr:RodZ domain-containing protein [Catenovulum agarivorans]
MTELTEQQESAEPQPTETVGIVLQAARIKLGLSEQDVAGSLNLKVTVIQGIENDDFTLIPVPTYIKGYLRAYAKLLSLDENQIIALYYQQQPVEYKPENKLKSFSKKTSQQAHDSRLMLVTYGIILVLVALIVVWWVQREAVVDDSAGILPTSSAANQTLPTTISEQQGPIQAQAEVVAEPAILAEPAAEDLNQGDSDLNESIVEAAPAVEENLLTEAEVHNLQMTFTGDCWINVVDSNGERVAYGVKEQGRIIYLNAAPPYEITLGAPEVVDIVFEDESIDMNQFKKGMVARFSLPLGLE